MRIRLICLRVRINVGEFPSSVFVYLPCVAVDSDKKDDEEEIMIIIDEVKADDVDETAAAAAEVAAPSSSAVQPALPQHKLSVAGDSGEIIPLKLHHYARAECH